MQESDFVGMSIDNLDEAITQHEEVLDRLHRARVLLMGEEPVIVKTRRKKNAAKRGRPKKPVAKGRARGKAKRGRPANASSDTSSSE